MVIEAINDFRVENGKNRIFTWDKVENDYCQLHSLHMANVGRLEHAPYCFLQHRTEIIDIVDYLCSVRDTIRYAIFVVFSESPEHREVLLDSERLSYGVIVSNGKIYLTIRSY